MIVVELQYGDDRAKIEIVVAVFRNQPRAFAMLERKIGARIGRIKR